METTPKVKVFDANTDEQIEEIAIPKVDDVNSIAIDAQNRKVFLSVDDKIFVFQNGSCSGMIYLPTSSVQSLHYDEGSGCLLVSMNCNGGKVEIYTPQAMETLLAISRDERALT